MVAEPWPERCDCRICKLKSAATSGYTFGAPFVCPKPEHGFYGVLKLPGERIPRTCPECDTPLVSLRKQHGS